MRRGSSFDYIRDPALRRMARIAYDLRAEMSSYSSGQGATALVEATPPFQSQSPNGRIWLDQGVNPDVVRVFDGVVTGLYQPGGIAPIVPGSTGLTLVASGKTLDVSFAGLAAGQKLSAFMPGVFQDTGTTFWGGITPGGGSCKPISGGGTGVTEIVAPGVAGKDAIFFAHIANVGAGTGSNNDGSIIGCIWDGTNGGFAAAGYQAGAQYMIVQNQNSGSNNQANVAYNSGDVIISQCSQTDNTVRMAKNNAGSPTLTDVNASGLLGVNFFLTQRDAGTVGNPSFDRFVICVELHIHIQGVRPGWAARLIASDGVTVIAHGVENGSGVIPIDCAGATQLTISGITGALQLFTDNTFATPVTGGRFPAVGNASAIFPGDLYQWHF